MSKIVVTPPAFCKSESLKSKLSSLIVTQHIGGNSVEAVEAMGQGAIENLVEYFNQNWKAIHRKIGKSITMRTTSAGTWVRLRLLL